MNSVSLLVSKNPDITRVADCEDSARKRLGEKEELEEQPET